MKKITEVLDAIPGAFERHQQGQSDAREGRIAERISITDKHMRAKTLLKISKKSEECAAEWVARSLPSSYRDVSAANAEAFGYAIQILEVIEDVEEWMVEWLREKGYERDDKITAVLQRILEVKGDR